MVASFEGLQATADREERLLQTDFTLRNTSGEHWPAGSGHAIGWQLYDPESDMFIQEGEWLPLASELKAGERQSISVPIQLPPEHGHYHVYISLLDAQHRWRYIEGEPFVLLEAEVRDRKAELHQAGIVTLSTLRRRRHAAAIRKLFTLPFLGLWSNRRLLRSLARRDIQARYRGSFGDMLWTVINPLLLMATYFFVFGVVLQSRLGADTSRSGFALYFLAGMLPWLPFAEALGRAPHVIIEHRNYVKKLVFPLEILPATPVVAALVTELFAAALFLACLLTLRGTVPITAALLPLLMIPQVLFTLGLSWLLAAFGVYFRDLTQVMGMLLTLWFFLTPICYPESSLPREAAAILTKNPMYTLVDSYRRILLDSRPPDWDALGIFAVVAAGAFFFGYACFHKLRKTFADVI